MTLRVLWPLGAVGMSPVGTGTQAAKSLSRHHTRNSAQYGDRLGGKKYGFPLGGRGELG